MDIFRLGWAEYIHILPGRVMFARAAFWILALENSMAWKKCRLDMGSKLVPLVSNERTRTVFYWDFALLSCSKSGFSGIDV